MFYKALLVKVYVIFMKYTSIAGRATDEATVLQFQVVNIAVISGICPPRYKK